MACTSVVCIPIRCEQLQAEGRKLCEFTRLAVDESVRSQAILGAIFHVACIYVINLHRCTDVLIEVNPRHVRFYERMLGFRRVAEERLDPVVNAPAVLMRLDLAHCASEIARLGGQRRSRGRERSFYPYFFAPREAACDRRQAADPLTSSRTRKASSRASDPVRVRPRHEC